MATRTASDLSAFVGDSKDNAIEVDLDNMDASDVEQLVKAATVNGNGKRNGKRKTISGSSSSSSSSTPSSHASNKKRRTGEKKKNKKKKKKKVTFSHSVGALEVPVPAVPVPAPNFPLFGFVDVAYLVFTVIWTACDLGSLMVEKSPDYESLRVRAFEELRGDEANDIQFPQHLAKHKTELIALVKENNWTTTTDVTLYKRKCEVDDMKGGLEGVQHQTLLFALLVYMDWRVNGLAESKPALFDESKTITECVKGLHFDYSSGGSAKNYLIETLYVATTGKDLPSHFTMKELGHGLEIGKEHGLKKEKMWKALCDTESSFLRKMVLALRKEEGDKRKAADMFWKGLTPVQQQALEEAATCVSAPDEATCKNFVMPDGKRSKKAPAKCSPFTFEMNDNDEFEFVVPEGSDGKKDAPHYVFLERPVEANARQQIEQVMFDEESSDEVIKALYGVLSLVKRVKKGKGNPLRWKESYIGAMSAFVVALNPVQEDEDDDDDMNEEESNEEDGSSDSSDSEMDSDASSDSDSDDDSDDEEEVEEVEDKGNGP